MAACLAAGKGWFVGSKASKEDFVESQVKNTAQVVEWERAGR